ARIRCVRRRSVPMRSSWRTCWCAASRSDDEFRWTDRARPADGGAPDMHSREERRPCMAHRGDWMLRMAATIAALTAALAVPATGAAAGGGNRSQSTIQRGFDAAPVPLNLAGKKRSLVGQGSYLVNVVASCNDCHAGPSGQYAAGGNPFQGQ